MEKEQILEFELFRVRLEKPSQSEMFHDFPERSDVLEYSIKGKPSLELKQTVKWHIGNVELRDNGWMHFLLGKTSLRKQEHLDKTTGDFVIMNGEESPFTYGMIHLESGVLAIARKTKVAPNTQMLASRFQQIVESSETVFKSNYNVVVKFIPDPREFHTSIKLAYAVKGFEFYVSPSNPIDIDSRIHQPSKDYVDDANASEGKLSIKGDQLDKEVIVKTANSIASVGDEASASIQKSPGDRATKVHLKGDPLKVSVKESELVNSKAEILLMDAYEKVKKLD